MAIQAITFPSFTGIRQDRNEYLLPLDQSPDACNMDTRDGGLSVCSGFSRAVEAPVPANASLIRFYLYPDQEHRQTYFACTAAEIFRYCPETGTWETFYQLGHPGTTQKFDFLPCKIGSDTRLLIAQGQETILCWDGAAENPTPFGSEEQLSFHPVNFLELYYGRLFAAGDKNHPGRLYWSQVPGDERTIEDWSSVTDAPDVSGGHVEVGTDNDPITGLFALSNQLLIFKRDALYRLLGDRPSNFRILPVDASFRQPPHTGCVRYADRLYFLTDEGLCLYNGQTVQRSPAHAALGRLLKQADFTDCVSACCNDTLYFAVRENPTSENNDVLIEYDVLRDRFMLRRGFGIAGMQGYHGTLYLLTDRKTVVRLDDSEDYDGEPIEAWWTTPRLDFGHKETKKQLGHFFCTGTGGPMRLSVNMAIGRYDALVAFSGSDNVTHDVVLRGEERVFTLRFSNVQGSRFHLDGKSILLADVQVRPM